MSHFTTPFSQTDCPHPAPSAPSSQPVSQELYQRGEAFANAGHYHEALANFDQAIALDATHIDAWVFRGVVLIHLERFAEALNSCDQAIALDGDHQEAWLFRGVALRHLDRYQDAYAAYDRAMGNSVEFSGFQQIKQALSSLWQRLSISII